MVALCVLAGGYGVYELTSQLRPPPCDETTLIGSLSSSDVSVSVYNGGTVNGLASSISTQLKGKGFNVLAAANNPDTVLSTTIVGGTEDAPEVQLVANFFPDSTIQADGRTNHTVDVLVGDNFGTFDDTASTSIAVATAVVCTPNGSVTGTPFPTTTTGGPGTVDTTTTTPPTAPSTTPTS